MKFRFFWLAVFLGLTVAATASAQESFFTGKTARIIVGFSAGGGFDLFSRTIARHMRRFIPGNPTIIVENMTGAGALIAANHIYKVAKPDGLTIGNIHGGLFFQQLLGSSGIEFDALKFEYVGVPVNEKSVCVMTKASGITSIEKWIASKVPVKLGSTGPGSLTYSAPKILNETLGLPIQLVTGYKGVADIRLAAESGELAGVCGWSWDSVKAVWTKAIESGDAVVVLQTVPQPHPDLPKVPLAINFAKTEEARQLIQSGIHDVSDVTYSYVLPPGTAKERVRILRRAFMDTMNDPEFLADAKKSRFGIDPLTGEEMERTLARLFQLSPAVAIRLKEILK
ncbi:MAG: hypothetical protein A2038_07325 [Deltaproteobacteria bacterium GWA2_57_13]|nr:MAG: hypothetical protein A2038_07325 [Deltaproteobacteria bacterium GWA2_57_13]OGQ74128.1 MAG: hypothetical protein A3G40_02055 [Deltaproteobacteria bacterium RIFCSPLOWO2_12_FULL_57_22]